MMAAITPMSTRGLIRFDDVLLSWANRDKNKNGMSGLGDEPVRYLNEVPIYYDSASNEEYTLDDYGNPTPLYAQTMTPVSTSATGGTTGATGGSSVNINIPGQTQPGQIQYALPDGTKVATKVNRPVASPLIPGVPNSYLLIGGAVFVVVMLMGRR